MMPCPKCGTKVLQDAASCDMCGTIFEPAEQNFDTGNQPVFARYGADGANPLAISYLVIGAGVLMFAYGILAPVERYAENIFIKYMFAVAGWGLINTGLLIWIGGYVASAIAGLRKERSRPG